MANEKRLIDANAMREDWLENGENEYVYDTNAVLASIDAQPPVEAVEVVHGRWLPDMEEFADAPAVGIRGGVFQTGWKCSICGRSEPVKEPYCNCGAKMDGDGNG